jgi:hypothetical protein
MQSDGSNGNNLQIGTLYLPTGVKQKAFVSCADSTTVGVRSGLDDVCKSQLISKYDVSAAPESKAGVRVERVSASSDCYSAIIRR